MPPKKKKSPEDGSKKKASKKAQPDDEALFSETVRLVEGKKSKPCGDLSLWTCGNQPMTCKRTWTSCVDSVATLTKERVEKATGVNDLKALAEQAGLNVADLDFDDVGQVRSSILTAAQASRCSLMDSALRRFESEDPGNKKHADRLRRKMDKMCQKHMKSSYFQSIVKTLKGAGFNMADFASRKALEAGAVLKGAAGKAFLKLVDWISYLAVKFLGVIWSFVPAGNNIFKALRKLFQYALYNPGCFTRAFASMVCGNKSTESLESDAGVATKALACLCTVYNWIICALKEKVFPNLPYGVGLYFSTQLTPTGDAKCADLLSSTGVQSMYQASKALFARRKEVMKDLGEATAYYTTVAGALSGVAVAGGVTISAPVAAVAGACVGVSYFGYSLLTKTADDFAKNPYGCPLESWKQLGKDIQDALWDGGEANAIKQVKAMAKKVEKLQVKADEAMRPPADDDVKKVLKESMATMPGKETTKSGEKAPPKKKKKSSAKKSPKKEPT